MGDSRAFAAYNIDCGSLSLVGMKMKHFLGARFRTDWPGA